MVPAYTSDKELEDLGNLIVKTTRTGLTQVRVAYVFREEAAMSDEKVVAGMCVRVDDRNHLLHNFDFIIEIAKDVWDAANADFRKALMDHELGHIGVRFDEAGQPMLDEKTSRLKTFIKRHSIEEFEEVLERHGAYHAALRQFLDAFSRHKTQKGKKNKKVDIDGDEDLS